MIEKYINDTITRTDLEDWVVTHSLENEYLKPFSGEPFNINAKSQYQVIEKPKRQQPMNERPDAPRQNIEIPIDETN